MVEGYFGDETFPSYSSVPIVDDTIGSASTAMQRSHDSLDSTNRNPALSYEIPDQLLDKDVIEIRGLFTGNSMIVQLLSSRKHENEKEIALDFHLERTGAWAAETTGPVDARLSKKGSVVMTRATQYELRIITYATHYDISINGLNACCLTHVIPLEDVTHLRIDGAVEVASIEFRDLISEISDSNGGLADGKIKSRSSSSNSDGEHNTFRYDNFESQPGFVRLSQNRQSANRQPQPPVNIPLQSLRALHTLPATAELNEDSAFTVIENTQSALQHSQLPSVIPPVESVQLSQRLSQSKNGNDGKQQSRSSHSLKGLHKRPSQSSPAISYQKSSETILSVDVAEGNEINVDTGELNLGGRTISASVPNVSKSEMQEGKNPKRKSKLSSVFHRHSKHSKGEHKSETMQPTSSTTNEKASKKRISLSYGKAKVPKDEASHSASKAATAPTSRTKDKNAENLKDAPNMANNLHNIKPSSNSASAGHLTHTNELHPLHLDGRSEGRSSRSSRAESISKGGIHLRPHHAGSYTLANAEAETGQRELMHLKQVKALSNDDGRFEISAKVNNGGLAYAIPKSRASSASDPESNMRNGKADDGTALKQADPNESQSSSSAASLSSRSSFSESLSITGKKRGGKSKFNRGSADIAVALLKENGTRDNQIENLTGDSKSIHPLHLDADQQAPVLASSAAYVNAAPPQSFANIDGEAKQNEFNGNYSSGTDLAPATKLTRKQFPLSVAETSESVSSSVRVLRKVSRSGSHDNATTASLKNEKLAQSKIKSDSKARLSATADGSGRKARKRDRIRDAFRRLFKRKRKSKASGVSAGNSSSESNELIYESAQAGDQSGNAYESSDAFTESNSEVSDSISETRANASANRAAVIFGEQSAVDGNCPLTKFCPGSEIVFPLHLEALPESTETRPIAIAVTDDAFDFGSRRRASQTSSPSFSDAIKNSAARESNITAQLESGNLHSILNNPLDRRSATGRTSSRSSSTNSSLDRMKKAHWGQESMDLNCIATASDAPNIVASQHSAQFATLPLANSALHRRGMSSSSATSSGSRSSVGSSCERVIVIGKSSDFNERMASYRRRTNSSQYYPSKTKKKTQHNGLGFQEDDPLTSSSESSISSIDSNALPANVVKVKRSTIPASERRARREGCQDYISRSNGPSQTFVQEPHGIIPSSKANVQCSAAPMDLMYPGESRSKPIRQEYNQIPNTKPSGPQFTIAPLNQPSNVKYGKDVWNSISSSSSSSSSSTSSPTSFSIMPTH